MQRPEAEKLPFVFSRWSDDHWKIPFALTAAVHLLGFVLLLVSPYLNSRPPMLEVQTVNLFTAQEIAPPKPAPKAAPAPPPPPPPAKVEKPAPKPVPVTPPPPPAATTQPAVSLKPLKKVEKKTTPDEEIKAKQTILERKLRQVQARIEQEQAEAAVKKEVDTALDRIRQSLATRPVGTGSSQTAEKPSPTPTASTATSGGDSGSVQVSEAKKRYYAAIQMHLGKYWTLPESHDWKESLEVIAVLWFRTDGTIVKRAIEQKSENDYFNRFVELTLEKVDRVPPIPLDMPAGESSQIVEEGLGFRFHPSGIY